MLAFGVQFFMSEGVRLGEVGQVLDDSDRRWLYFGALLSLLYVLLHGLMYRDAFRAIGRNVRLGTMTQLYIRRNFISVFLPAGFLASQAFFTEDIARREGVRTREVAAASGIFAASGLLSMVILVVPALGWLLTQRILPEGATLAFLLVNFLVFSLIWVVFSIIRKGRAYRFLERNAPSWVAWLDREDWPAFQSKYLMRVVLWSCVVELAGVAHVWVAARALGIDLSLSMAFAGYLAVIFVLMTSPFLRGIGAVEALLSFVLIRYGVPALGAASTAILFRFFEFWGVLLLAVPVFLLRPKSLLIRVVPSLLLFALGVVNILSGLTPGLPERLHALRDYLPIEAMHASTTFTVASGFIMLATALYLLRGLRSAWWVAAGLSTASLISHMAKGFDYEEATLALLTLGALLYQRGEYNAKTDFRFVRKTWMPALIVANAVLLLGTIGFFLLKHRHFGVDFTWEQSAGNALRSFLLLEPASVMPLTHFAAEFLNSLHVLGVMSILFLAYAIFRPLLPQQENGELDREKALELVRQYGHSAYDYFKTASDKRFYFTHQGETFVAYKNTARYSLVLENPVAPDDSMMQESVREFDQFCRKSGLRSIYYRIPESSAGIYRALGKSLLPLGQEAVVNLQNFTMEGKERKSLRNAVSKMEREGYLFAVHEAPLNGRVLQQLRAVSDEWLRMLHRKEMGFSQGVFDEIVLKNQTILSIEDKDGKILVFVNLIPGGTPTEANFDLMRRTADAPPGAMDFMFVKMFAYLQSKGYTHCNLGLVPLSGLGKPSNLPENVLKLAYERLPWFSGYKSLRFFKEKFDPEWEMRYVAYDSQMDLVNLPMALTKAVRNRPPRTGILSFTKNHPS